jgi:predicted permease
MVSQDIGLDLFPYQDLVAGPVRTPVRVLFGAIGFVLLIACANVANLVLGRATTRERELALRAALGAGRGRLLRGLVAESLILALAGGALGLLLANWGLQGLLAMVPAGLPRAETIRLDGWAFAFTFGLSLLTGIVFGLAPAWRTARRDLHERLREGTGRATEGMARGRARGALVVGEVALSVVLLVGAMLLLRTFANLLRTDPGFATDHLLTAEIWLRGTRYDSTGTIGAFYRELTERLEALPGVRSAAVVEAGLPLQRGGNLGVQVDGEWLRMASEYRTVTPNYLQVLGVPLVRGRMFTAGDAAGAEPVAIVNQAFAQRHLGDAEALGRVLKLGGDAPRRVIGVVGNLKSFIGAPAAPGVFIPSAQTSAGMTRGFSSWYPIHVVVRTAVEPAVLGDPLARTIRETDAAVPVGRVRTMEEVLAGSLAFQRFVMLLLSLFAAMGVVLAAVGIYGVMSYSAARRTHEIGVRLALGAVPGDVVRLVLRRGMALTGAGVVLGLAGALALTRLLASTLFGVTPTDPLTFGAVTALLAVVALMACYLPARRAAGGDPVEALRYE